MDVRTRGRGRAAALPWIVLGTVLVLATVAAAAHWLAAQGSSAPALAPRRADGASRDASLAREGAPALDASAPGSEEGGTSRALAAASTGEERVARVRWAARVVEQDGGDPIPEAQVALEGAGLEVAGETNVAGWAELEVPEGVVQAALAVRHPGYVDVLRPRVDLSSPVELDLVRSATLHGRVSSPIERAFSGAAVCLWSLERTRLRGAPEATLVLDAGGIFAFEDLQPGEYALALAAETGPLVYERGIRLEAGERRELELAWPQGGILVARVELRGGAPVTGATVRLLPRRQGASDAVRAVGERGATTDGRGEVRLVGLASGQYEVVVRAPWGARDDPRDVFVPGDGEQVERTFALWAPARLSGSVFDAQGRGVAGATVSLVLQDELGAVDWTGRGPASSLVRSVTTGSEGAFDLGEVPSRTRLALAARSSDGASVAFERALRLLDQEVRTGIALVLPPTRALRGSVVDSAGRALAGVTVTASVRAKGFTPWLEVRSDGGGRFALALPEGRARLAFEQPGYRGDRQIVEVEADLELEPVVLERELAVRGMAVDGDGSAVAGTLVRAVEQGVEEPRRRGGPCDEFGRFELAPLEPGLWLVDARAVGWTSRPVALRLEGDDVGPILLELAPEERAEPASVRGELVIAGSGEPPEGLVLRGARGGTVARDGAAFLVTGMRPGFTRLIAEAPGFEPVHYPLIELRPGERVDLAPAETRRLGRLSVLVQGPGGHPLEGAHVALELLPEAQGGFGAGPKELPLEAQGAPGRFQGHFPRYRWRLRVVHPAHRLHTEVVALKARTALVVHLGS